MEAGGLVRADVYNLKNSYQTTLPRRVIVITLPRVFPATRPSIVSFSPSSSIPSDALSCLLCNVISSCLDGARRRVAASIGPLVQDKTTRFQVVRLVGPGLYERRAIACCHIIPGAKLGSRITPCYHVC